LLCLPFSFRMWSVHKLKCFKDCSFHSSVHYKA
jgi:hypothetical protein